MKRMSIFLAILLASAAVWAQGFEGTITASNSLRPSHSTAYLVKGDQTVQTPMGPGLADVKVFTDLSDNAYYLRIAHPGNNTQVMHYFLSGSSRQSSAQPVSFSGITATGNQQTIDGYDCDEYTGTADGQPFTAWVAEDLGALNLTAHVTPQTFEQLAYAELPGVSGLVLEFNSFTSNGQGFTTTLDVNPHAVDPATMQAPAATVNVD